MQEYLEPFSLSINLSINPARGKSCEMKLRGGLLSEPRI